MLYYIAKYFDSSASGNGASVEFYSDPRILVEKMSEYLEIERQIIQENYSSFDAETTGVTTTIPENQEDIEKLLELVADAEKMDSPSKEDIEKIGNIMTFYIEALVNNGENYFSRIQSGLAYDKNFTAIFG